MRRDHLEVLQRVILIANQLAFDHPRCFKSILRYLRRVLELEEAAFLVLDETQGAFTRFLQASGPELFLPCHKSFENTPEGISLQRRKPYRSPSYLHLPVCNRKKNFGVLSLRTPPGHPLSEDLLQVLQGACHQLASLVQSGTVSADERRRVRQLTLLSELGRDLTQAQDLRELLQVGVRTLQRHAGAACVILRPVYGETLLGRSQVRISPAARGMRRTFLQMEEDLSLQVLASGRPVFRQSPLQGEEEGGYPLTLVSVALKAHDQVLGTLTLFGFEDGKGLPLAADREARRLFVAVGSLVAHALERVAGKERLTSLSAENQRKLQETTLLYRTSRAMHSTLRLNELMHLILSAAASPEGGGFERAMLFTVNQRSGTLQGMLGVTAGTAALVLPPQQGALAWERPELDEEVQSAQRRSRFCRQVMKQRLALDPEDNALARAVCLERVLSVGRSLSEPSSGAVLAETLGLGPYACAPMLGRDRALGVLVVDNPDSKEEITADRLRFLELFANLAGAAMENSMLLNRLETAHQDLRETQERLIQGEKMAGLGEMAASVAHELRNPLVAIGGFAQRLNRLTTAGSREREYSGIVVREVRRMEEMLANILAFSRKQMLCFAPCDIVEIIEEALSLEADALNRRAVRLVTEIARDLPTIRGDEQKLRQVMINLIANALQVMPAGGTLTLRAYPDALRGDRAVAVEVEDTGGGITPEVMRNIFNPFFTTKEEGTGLGLSISHRIIEHHGGEIEVQNREKGAVFILRLPTSSIQHLSIDKNRWFG